MTWHSSTRPHGVGSHQSFEGLVYHHCRHLNSKIASTVIVAVAAEPVHLELPRCSYCLCSFGSASSSSELQMLNHAQHQNWHVSNQWPCWEVTCRYMQHWGLANWDLHIVHQLGRFSSPPGSCFCSGRRLLSFCPHDLTEKWVLKTFWMNCFLLLRLFKPLGYFLFRALRSRFCWLVRWCSFGSLIASEPCSDRFVRTCRNYFWSYWAALQNFAWHPGRTFESWDSCSFHELDSLLGSFWGLIEIFGLVHFNFSYNFIKVRFKNKNKTYSNDLLLRLLPFPILFIKLVF